MEKYKTGDTFFQATLTLHGEGIDHGDRWPTWEQAEADGHYMTMEADPVRGCLKDDFAYYTRMYRCIDDEGTSITCD